jgi:LacI family repressor for deo operon, udp, cdd, tsx, nupC, and nupG
MLDSLLQPDRAEPSREVILPHRLIVRQSTAAPRKRKRK